MSYITLRAVRIATEYSIRYRHKDSPPGSWVEYDTPVTTFALASSLARELAKRYDEQYIIQIVALHVDVCEEFPGEYRKPEIRSR